jgi:hypothetical protein
MARSLAFAVSAALLLALTACGSGGSPTPAHTQAGAGASQTDCVTGTWELDTTDAANVVLQYLIGLGAPVTDGRADGPVVLEFGDDGSASYRTGVTYDFTADADGVGMEVMSAQTGSATGEWGWAGSSDTVMQFSGWTTDVATTNTVEIGGMAADFPLSIPDMSPGSTPLTVNCAGDVLTTKADAAPFTLRWTRG